MTTPTAFTVPLSTATLTLTPTPANSPEETFTGPLVAFTASDESSQSYILILDLSTGSTRRLQMGTDVPINVSWRPDGCGIDITLTTLSGIQLITGDLELTKPQTVFSGGKRVDGGFATWPVLSPDGKRVAYTVLSGVQSYIGSEFQDIEVITVNRQDDPSVLTSRGGAWSAAWSPNSDRLAYSDYDDSGVAQLFQSDPEGGGKTQLTRFTAAGTRIGAVEWSPLGNMIAFLSYDGISRESLWMVSIDGEKQLSVEAEGGNLGTDAIWWSEDGGVLVFYTQRSHEQGAQDDVIYWINTSGQVTRTLEARETPLGRIAQPFPAGGTQFIGLVGATGIIVYDSVTGAFSEHSYEIDWQDLTGQAYAAPPKFLGESNCQR
jgi:Tol biopolymer transport system component